MPDPCDLTTGSREPRSWLPPREPQVTSEQTPSPVHGAAPRGLPPTPVLCPARTAASPRAALALPAPVRAAHDSPPLPEGDLVAWDKGRRSHGGYSTGSQPSLRAPGTALPMQACAGPPEMRSVWGWVTGPPGTPSPGSEDAVRGLVPFRTLFGSGMGARPPVPRSIPTARRARTSPTTLTTGWEGQLPG